MITQANTSSNIVVARLLLPDDANIAGNVHGGTTLKLMEEAGMIAATRHMSSRSLVQNVQSALVRFDTMTFYQPIFVGEVASCQCEIIFTSKQSILVEVVVTAEDISKGKTRVTNTGWLWYVPMAPTVAEKKNWEILQVPPIMMPEGEAAIQKYEKAKAKYEKRKTQNRVEGGAAGEAIENMSNCEFDAFKSQYSAPSEGRSPSESEQVLCQMVHPGDCGKGKVAFGGFVMKLMDNAAGCSSFRHCRTNVVTVAISDMDFVSWVRLGDCVTIKSKVVFTSSKSLEIEVVASVVSVTSDAINGKDNIVARGLFTFLSIGSDGKVQAVPKLLLESEEDMQNAFFGLHRYEAAKRARMKGSP